MQFIAYHTLQLNVTSMENGPPIHECSEMVRVRRNEVRIKTIDGYISYYELEVGWTTINFGNGVQLLSISPSMWGSENCNTVIW